MKKQVLSLTLCLLFTICSAVAFAQDGQSGQDGPEVGATPEIIEAGQEPNCHTEWGWFWQRTYHPILPPYLLILGWYEVCD